MKTAILILQLIISITLMAVILLQSRGTGLGSAFGGTSEQYRSKRGMEQLLYKATVVLIALFFLTSIINLLVK